MHKKTFVIEMPDGIDIQPETIVYALSYISNHEFIVTEAAKPTLAVGHGGTRPDNSDFGIQISGKTADGGQLPPCR